MDFLIHILTSTKWKKKKKIASVFFSLMELAFIIYLTLYKDYSIIQEYMAC